MNQKGIVIAYLLQKYRKKTKAGQTYYLLSVTIQQNLTKMYFQLTKKKWPTLRNNSQPLYLFTNQNK
jgi:hypothetical protein